MRGFTGTGNLFHADLECIYMHGSVRELPESTALKWGLEYCPECNDE